MFMRVSNSCDGAKVRHQNTDETNKVNYPNVYSYIRYICKDFKREYAYNWESINQKKISQQK